MSLKPFLVSLLLLLVFCLSPQLQARDPRVDEMSPIQEIAYYLNANAGEVSAVLRAQAQADFQFRRTLDPIERLSEKAGAFYDRAMKNGKSPWRTVSAYEELNEAFVDAQVAFGEQAAYRLDPRVFEEIAYLMGALLQYYYYAPPNDDGAEGVYSYQVYAAYPLVVYPWIPSYYNFSRCRFANARAFPWGRRVNFGNRNASMTKPFFR